MAVERDKSRRQTAGIVGQYHEIVHPHERRFIMTNKALQLGEQAITMTASSAHFPNGRMLESFEDIKRRTPVVIDHDLCTGCKLCIHACPQSVLKTIPDVHRLEGLVAVVYNPALCTACRQCEDVCPDFCIMVREGR